MTLTTTDFETVCEIVGDWGAQTILDIVAVLMPNGRPFGYVEDPAARMRDYLALRGNPQAWQEYIVTQAQEIQDKLTSSGLDESQVLSVHPYDLAQKFALEFSIHMEEELNKNARTLAKSTGKASKPILSTGSSAQGPVGNPA